MVKSQNLCHPHLLQLERGREAGRKERTAECKGGTATGRNSSSRSVGNSPSAQVLSLRRPLLEHLAASSCHMIQKNKSSCTARHLLCDVVHDSVPSRQYHYRTLWRMGGFKCLSCWPGSNCAVLHLLSTLIGAVILWLFLILFLTVPLHRKKKKQKTTV